MSTEEEKAKLEALFGDTLSDGGLSDLSDDDDLGAFEDDLPEQKDIALELNDRQLESTAEKQPKFVQKQKKPSKSRAKPQKRQRVQAEYPSDDEEEPELVQTKPISAAVAEFDQVVDSFKSKRYVRDLQDEAEADEMISAMCLRMKQATDLDVLSNQESRAATARLKLLSQVEDLIRKTYLHEQLLDHEILECMRQWLEPLPNGSLPSINIRKSVLEMLRALPQLDPDQVRDSRIGRIVMFYARNEKELPALKKIATELIYIWSRPLLKHQPQVRASQSVATNQAKVELDGQKRLKVGDMYTNTTHARIPTAIRSSYVVQPESKVHNQQGRESLGGGQQTSLQKRMQKLKQNRN